MGVQRNNCVVPSTLSALQPLLPSPCTPADAELLVQRLCGTDPALRQFGGVVTTKAFLQSCFESFQPLLKEKAQEVDCSPHRRMLM